MQDGVTVTTGRLEVEDLETPTVGKIALFVDPLGISCLGPSILWVQWNTDSHAERKVVVEVSAEKMPVGA